MFPHALRFELAIECVKFPGLPALRQLPLFGHCLRQHNVRLFPPRSDIFHAPLFDVIQHKRFEAGSGTMSGNTVMGALAIKLVMGINTGLGPPALGRWATEKRLGPLPLPHREQRPRRGGEVGFGRGHGVTFCYLMHGHTPSPLRDTPPSLRAKGESMILFSLARSVGEYGEAGRGWLIRMICHGGP